jgi:hypothetical protein
MASHVVFMGIHSLDGCRFDPVLVLKLIDVIGEKSILKITQHELENSRKTLRVRSKIQLFCNTII